MSNNDINLLPDYTMFVLTGGNAGKTKTFGGSTSNASVYSFDRGVMQVPDGIADKIEKIVCRYHGAKRVPKGQEKEILGRINQKPEQSK